MRALYTFAVICAAGTASSVKSINRRQFNFNEAVNYFDSEILSASLPLLVSQEDPTDTRSGTTQCSSPSAQWLRQQVRNVSEEDLSNFFDWRINTLPFAYKLFVEKSQYQSEYFGLNGEHTHEINSIHEEVQSFWSDSGVDDEIYVLGAHGSDLADVDKLIPTLEFMFVGSYDANFTADDHAADIQDLISRLPGGYEHPLLTFNAFATDEGDGIEHSTIMIGDGYFEFQESMGFGSEGPEYALTHEHAHHLQYALGVQDEDDDTRQAARREELMADAFSAYFLAHNSGGDMTVGEMSDIHSVAYSVGDCVISHDGHHGTPQQRRCATKWGASIAHSPDSVDIDLFEIKQRFDLWYERIDDLDDLCEHSKPAAQSRMHNLISIPQAIIVAVFGIANLLGLVCYLSCFSEYSIYDLQGPRKNKVYIEDKTVPAK
mmetsp:Transcript_20877/g.44006  ORF Transcript_20877/g.44006 Transcript_20877/m.44006 type:complete len:432 (+) Transcript_20877:57-1352(+)